MDRCLRGRVQSSHSGPLLQVVVVQVQVAEKRLQKNQEAETAGPLRHPEDRLSASPLAQASVKEQVEARAHPDSVMAPTTTKVGAWVLVQALPIQSTVHGTTESRALERCTVGRKRGRALRQGLCGGLTKKADQGLQGAVLALARLVL